MIGSPCTNTAVKECAYGEECCCGECSSSMVYSCSDSTWTAYATDFCEIQSCQSGKIRKWYLRNYSELRIFQPDGQLLLPLLTVFVLLSTPQCVEWMVRLTQTVAMLGVLVEWGWSVRGSVLVTRVRTNICTDIISSHHLMKMPLKLFRSV